MEVLLSLLTCGYNASGHSSLFSVEKVIRTERKVVNRVLINVGDGCQRFCQEHKIKMSNLSTIVITSLAPHNISGFPGIFLALSDLGIGELKVFGPPGLKAYLQFMTPFINRKYPALVVVEVEEPHEIKLRGIKLRLHPVQPAGSGKVVAVACNLIGLNDQSFSFDDTSTLPGRSLTVLPCATYFPTQPSLDQLSAWARLESPSTVFLFSPLASASFDVASSAHVDSDGAAVEVLGERFQDLKSLCVEGSVGMVFPNALDGQSVDYCFSQALIMKMREIFPPLFPRPFLTEANTAAVANVLSLESGKVFFARSMQLRLSDQASSSGTAARAELTFERRRRALEAHTQFCSRLLEVSERVLTFCAGDLYSADSGRLTIAVDSPAGRDLVVESPLSSGSVRDNRRAAANLFSRLASKRKLDLGTDDPPSLASAGTAVTISPADRSLSDSANRSGTPFSSMSFRSARGEWPPAQEDGSRAGDTPTTLPPAAAVNTFARPPAPDGAPLKMARSLEPAVGAGVPSIAIPAPPRWLSSEQTVQLVSVPPPNPCRDTFEVTFLGTGCATPSKHRSNSAILIRLLANESTCAQAVRAMRSLTPKPAPPSEPPRSGLTIDTFLGWQGLSFDTSFGSETDQPDPTAADLVPLAPEGCFMLLDCGESAASQLFQSVQGDVDRFDSVLLRIKVIWISHHHADHTTGVPMLLQHIYAAQIRRQRREQAALAQEQSSDDSASDGDADGAASMEEHHELSLSCAPKHAPPAFWNKYMVRQHSESIAYEDDKIMLVSSEPVLKYCEFAATAAGLGDLVSFCPITSTLYAGSTSDVARATGGLVRRLQSIPVQHCQGAFGVVIECVGGQKIVYSGDCRPSQSLVKSGLQCDLLIHEATFDDDRCGDAVKKRHSTLSEAVDVATRMQARCTVLTHFSQRYPLAHSSSAQRGRTAGGCPVAAAYDFMHFSFPSQACALSEASAAIAQVFARVARGRGGLEGGTEAEVEEDGDEEIDMESTAAVCAEAD